MRSNGLTATSYVPVADLLLTVTTDQLEELRTQGVAAYAEPLGSGRERLYVATDAYDRVSTALAASYPDAVEGDDLAWARIVAGFDAPSAAVGRWPASEDDPGPPADEVDLHHDRPDVFDPDWHAPAGSRTTRTDEEPDDRYVPPTPEPLPPLDPLRTAAWTAVIGGPLLLIVTALLQIVLPQWLAGLAVLAFVAGFVTLVVLMRTSDDDPGDGAVV